MKAKILCISKQGQFDSQTYLHISSKHNKIARKFEVIYKRQNGILKLGNFLWNIKF